MAEGLRDALFSIEKSLQPMNDLDIHTRSSQLLLLNGRTTYHLVCGLLFQRLYLGLFSRHYHFWSERDCLTFNTLISFVLCVCFIDLQTLTTSSWARCRTWSTSRQTATRNCPTGQKCRLIRQFVMWTWKCPGHHRWRQSQSWPRRRRKKKNHSIQRMNPVHQKVSFS